MTAPHLPTAAVRESFAQAQQQAAAMAGPPTPWRATRARGRARRWAGLAAAALAAGGVAGWLGADRQGGPAQGGASAPTQAVPADGAAFAQPAPAAASPAEMAPSLAVTRHAGTIRIGAAGASLADAVRALAQATRTQVHGGEVLAAVASPVTLQWQGQGTPAAWDALLGRFANFALSCGGETCTLWIAGLDAPRAAGEAIHTSPAVETVPPPPAARPQAEPAPAPDGDENTETN